MTRVVEASPCSVEAPAACELFTAMQTCESKVVEREVSSSDKAQLTAACKVRREAGDPTGWCVTAADGQWK